VGARGGNVGLQIKEMTLGKKFSHRDMFSIGPIREKKAAPRGKEDGGGCREEGRSRLRSNFAVRRQGNHGPLQDTSRMKRGLAQEKLNVGGGGARNVGHWLAPCARVRAMNKSNRNGVGGGPEGCSGKRVKQREKVST